jgi:preprotein translocase subunit SecA
MVPDKKQPLSAYGSRLAEISRLEPAMATLTDDEIQAKTEALKARMLAEKKATASG